MFKHSYIAFSVLVSAFSIQAMDLQKPAAAASKKQSQSGQPINFEGTLDLSALRLQPSEQKPLVISNPTQTNIATDYKHTLVIDPSGGGKYTGAQGATGHYMGKDCALAISLLLAEKLKAQPVKVVMTRSKDECLDQDHKTDLKKRVEIAQQAQANLFLTVGINAHANKDVHGFEVYVPMTTNYPAECYTAAGCIHHQLSQQREKQWAGILNNVNLTDRGIRGANYTVFQDNPAPAVMVLLDHISNPTIEAMFAKAEVRDSAAGMLAAGIVKYFDIKAQQNKK